MFGSWEPDRDCSWTSPRSVSTFLHVGLQSLPARQHQPQEQAPRRVPVEKPGYMTRRVKGLKRNTDRAWNAAQKILLECFYERAGYYCRYTRLSNSTTRDRRPIQQ